MSFQISPGAEAPNTPPSNVRPNVPNALSTMVTPVAETQQSLHRSSAELNQTNVVAAAPTSNPTIRPVTAPRRAPSALAHSLKHGQRSQGIEAQTDQEIGAIGTNYETSGVHFLNQAGERTGAIRYVIAYPGSDAEHTLRARLPPAGTGSPRSAARLRVTTERCINAPSA